VSYDWLPLDYDAYDAFISEHIYGKAAFSAALTPDVDLNVSAWMFLQDDFFYENMFSTGQRIWDGTTNFNKYGLNGSLTWRIGQHTVVAGGEALNGRLKSIVLLGETLDQRKYAFFINDTIKAGIFSITPGLRYDSTNIGGDFISPSLGVACVASRDLLLRLLVSRGFHDPRIMDSVDSPVSGYVGNPDLRPEKIWSYQAGAEANILNIFTAKFTLFLHDIADLIRDKDLGSGLSTVTNVGRARTTGGEIEIVTNAYKGFKLKGGVHYENI
jgi:vitamin B12 transporter